MASLSFGQPLHNPVVPFVFGVPAPLPDYGLFSLEGFIPADSQGFAVNLQTGPAVNPRDDVALHLGFAFLPSGTELSVNTIQRNNWAVPVKFPSCPLRKMEPFQILILVERRSFMVAFKNQHFCEFNHRMDPSTIRFIAVDGGVVVNRLLLEFPGGLQQSLQHQIAQPQTSYSTNNSQIHMNQMMPPNVGPVPSYASFPAPAGYSSHSASSGFPGMLPTGAAGLGALGSLAAMTGPLFYPGKQQKMCKKGKKQCKYYGGPGLPGMGMMGGNHMGGQVGLMGPGLAAGLGAATCGLGMKKMKHGKHGKHEKHGKHGHDGHGWSHSDHHGKSSSSSSSSSDSD